MRSATRLAVAVGLFVAVGLAPGAHAQEGQWMRVDIVQVLPDKLEEYIELQIEQVNPALQRAGVPYRSSWRTAEFGNTYERLFVTPISNLADFDTGGPLARALEPDRLDRIRDRVRRCTQSRQSYAIRYHPEMSVEVDNPSGLFLAQVATIQIAPGRQGEWEAFLRENLPQFRESDVVFGVYERRFGPGPASWQIVENHSSYAALDQPNILERAFGDQAEEVAARLSGIVTSVERTVLRYDAELSFSAPAPTTQQQE
ncbi:MAG: hypothetical protein OXH04_19520 [Acidobacteria bacterium]|nr:hypothetical protein [Acidobacteriota bacterium]